MNSLCSVRYVGFHKYERSVNMMNYVLKGLMDFSIAYYMSDTINGKYDIGCTKLSYWVTFPILHQ